MALSGMIRVNDKTLRFCGPDPREVPAMKQTHLSVGPTITEYQFEGEGVELTVQFVTPALADDIDLLSRPVSGIRFSVRSIDGTTPKIKLYFDATAEWCVNSPDQKVTWSRHRAKGLEILSFSPLEQNALNRSGDDLRIDWGHFLLAGPSGCESAIAADRISRSAFVKLGLLPEEDDLRMPRPVEDDWPVLSTVQDFGSVSGKAAERWLFLAYDDIDSIEYLRRRLQGFWRRNGQTILGAVRDFSEHRDKLLRQCQQFDQNLIKTLTDVGGEKYAQIGALAYRQSMGAHKIVADVDGKPLMFSKENFSNGCIATVDVTYPGSPLFLLLNPDLLVAQIRPVLDYAMLPRWPHMFAPHDLGQYPLANGQVYGDGEHGETNQMPVEECGNLLILASALARTQENKQFLSRYKEMFQKWADYLVENGLDPKEQLCTDDFAGHLARNANLSMKAIVAIGAYSQMSGDPRYRKIAEDYAAKWQSMAASGDHFSLVFGKPETWSQKYNLVWDHLLGLNLFPPNIAAKEIAYYKTKLQKYGLPLDNRSLYTKGDWCLWTATMTTNKADFDAIVSPFWEFLSDSPSRVPMSDWHWTDSGKQVGFQARSVVGGMFMPALAKAWGKR